MPKYPSIGASQRLERAARNHHALASGQHGVAVALPSAQGLADWLKARHFPVSRLRSPTRELWHSTRSKTSQRGRLEGSAYLSGYVVELALKARICRTLKWRGFPEKRNEFEGLQTFKTHDLDVLLSLSGRESWPRSGLRRTGRSL